jgi:hypothetical protein
VIEVYEPQYNKYKDVLILKTLPTRKKKSRLKTFRFCLSPTEATTLALLDMRRET